MDFSISRGSFNNQVRHLSLPLYISFLFFPVSSYTPHFRVYYMNLLFVSWSLFSLLSSSFCFPGYRTEWVWKLGDKFKDRLHVSLSNSLGRNYFKHKVSMSITIKQTEATKKIGRCTKHFSVPIKLASSPSKKDITMIAPQTHKDTKKEADICTVT